MTLIVLTVEKWHIDAKVRIKIYENNCMIINNNNNSLLRH